jgi:hypothetical protein
VAFTESDLNLLQVEIDQIKAALVNTGIANAFTNTMAEQEAKVDDYTAAYTIGSDRKKRLWRPLVIYQVWTLLKSVDDDVRQAYEDAMKEMESIRDGKFATVLPPSAAPPTPAGGGGKWGGEPKINARASADDL